MRIVIAKDYEDLSARAAMIVAGQICLKPNSVLGLATGSTPLLMYEKLVEMHRTVGLDFSEAISFNLDEYLGLSPEDEHSYHWYMYQNFFHHINMAPRNIHIPDGTAKDVEKECREYDRSIQAAGGIDLQILGIGTNGHIGFNEPDIKFEATTHKVKLDQETVTANSRFFTDLNDVPRYAISMGIKTIMHAKKILLLANGEAKAAAIYKTLYRGITPETPASILQLHQDVTVIVEESAAKFIQKDIA